MELNLIPNVLYDHPQTIYLNKVTTLIGENGSGKSSVLQSIFNQKLSKKDYTGQKIVCFSSGQNEKFSNEFLRYLRQTQTDENNLQFSCFYFDKSWSKLLIFLASSIKKSGKVRQFLISSGYADEVDGLDTSSILKIAFRVDSQYVRQVQDALNREARGDTNTIRQTAFHRTLESFIENCIQDQYDFDEPIKKNVFDIRQDDVLSVSFDTERLEDGDASKITFDPEIGFFIRACHNTNFLDKEASSLFLKNGLELGDLSDGEFQILFLYSIIDLFDSEETIFIFDEADSHLHFKNVERFWNCLKETKGKTISTTHLLDSIYCVGVENIRIINKGKIYLPSDSGELITRLAQLSNIKKSEFRALTYYEKIVLIDDTNDWFIFKELYKQYKRIIGVPDFDYDAEFDHLFDQVAVVKVNSGWNTHNAKFAESKISWVQNFNKFCEGLDIKTKDIFLVCDRDNLPIDGIGTDESPLIVQGIKIGSDNNIKTSVLSWRRREIKHYLLSYSALGGCVAVLNNKNRLPEASYLREGYSSDYLLEYKNNDYQLLIEDKEVTKGKKTTITSGPVYNHYLASLPSRFVKNILSPFIENVEAPPYGLNRELLLEYISMMHPSEISEDIKSMYDFIIGK
ncbi:AAA family ATPase [Enterobacter sp. RHBSTW-00593]|uniref:AAA family ATPase n=1 Tax=Enterobacter sp. RHBSTW-00593 TaxID=2742656 RepID=UPI0015EB0BB4|nr:AAA family ATPase [Enterobacter sp. RHBSTW-00593]QLX96706.1 ATP-binding protein [Enterobacter sp. RHBSTW-00593]